MTKSEKTIVFFSIGLVLFLIYLIVFSNHGLLDYIELKQTQNAITRKAQAIETENTRLEYEIQSLKTNEEYIRHIAKQEHEMAEEGELIFKKRSGTTESGRILSVKKDRKYLNQDKKE